MDAGDVLALSVPVAAAALAWLYQKALERQERRIARYEKIMELANALLSVGRNPDHLDEILTEIRKLWLSAPKHIIEASTRFRESTDTGQSSREAEIAFQHFVRAMRRDCTIGAVLWPRLALGQLAERDVKLMVAKR